MAMVCFWSNWSTQRKVCSFLIVVLVAAIAIVFISKFIARQSIKNKCEDDDELFYKDTGRCYKRGTQGPCTETMVLLEKEPRSLKGKCSCPYTNNPRPILFHAETNHCYYIFTQAFCEEGFWINVTRKGEPFCEENYCLSEFDDLEEIPDEIVPLRGGRCGILNHHTEAEECLENETLKYFRNHIYPRCGKPNSFSSGFVGVRASECPLGSYPSIVGKCQPDFNF